MKDSDDEDISDIRHVPLWPSKPSLGQSSKKVFQFEAYAKALGGETRSFLLALSKMQRRTGGRHEDGDSTSWHEDIIADLPPSFIIGAVVGSSGSGKTRLLDALVNHYEPLTPRSVPIDPARAISSHQNFRNPIAPRYQGLATYQESAAEATMRFGGAGLNKVAAWGRPFLSLSAGEQARALIGMIMTGETAKASKHGLVLDDFGAMLDDLNAQAVAHSLQHMVRKDCRRFIFIGTCKWNVIPFLQPDFVVSSDSRIIFKHPEPIPTMGIFNPGIIIADLGLQGGFQTGRNEAGWLGTVVNACEVDEKRRMPFGLGSLYNPILGSGAFKTLEVHVVLEPVVEAACGAFDVKLQSPMKTEVACLSKLGCRKLSEPFTIGLIAGPSGTGESTCRAQLIEQFVRRRGLPTEPFLFFDPFEVLLFMDQDLGELRSSCLHWVQAGGVPQTGRGDDTDGPERFGFGGRGRVGPPAGQDHEHDGGLSLDGVDEGGGLRGPGRCGFGVGGGLSAGQHPEHFRKV